LVALEALLAEGSEPALLRLPSIDVASLIVGTWCPSPPSRGDPLGLVSSPEPELLCQVQRLWRRLDAATRGHLWLTTTVNSETHAWAQRAASLAFFGVRGLWVVAPTRHGAHNWEEGGRISAVHAIEALASYAASGTGSAG